MAAINELDAFCIALPHNISPFSMPDNPVFVPVVKDEFIDHHTMGLNVSTLSGWSVTSHICRQRATLTVDSSLLVTGQAISPEAYIARWRARLADPVPVSRLALDKGLRAVAVFQWRHSPELAARKASWVNPPYPTFGDLLAAHGFHTDAVPASMPDFHLSTLKVDLATPNGPRIAWWADDYLSSHLVRDRVLSRRLEFQRVPYDAQPVSFHFTPSASAEQADAAVLL